MDWFLSAIGKKENSTETVQSEVPLPPSFQLEEDSNACVTCDNPCNVHACLPDHLAKKINQTNQLLGTVKSYQKHIFICTNENYNEWEPKIEKQEGSFGNTMSKQIKSMKEETETKVLFTYCDETTAIVPTHSSIQEGKDIMVFPDLVRYHNVKKEQLQVLLGSHLLKNEIAPSIEHTKISSDKKYLFICGHKKRDKRCGVAGPMLMEQFNTILNEKGLNEKVSVYLCSHYGGHKYAGNVIIYPEGVWYGRVTTCHVEPIVQQHIIEGKVLKHIWRGNIDHVSKKSES